MRVLNAVVSATSVLLSQAVYRPQYPAPFQSWSISTCRECMQLVVFVGVQTPYPGAKMLKVVSD